MELSKGRSFLVLVSSCIALCLTSFWMPKECLAADMTICPSKIVLNVSDENNSVKQDVQAVVRQPMPSGCSLPTDFDVSLIICSNSSTSEGCSEETSPYVEAYDLRYCVVDDNFLVSFDRQAVEYALTGYDFVPVMVYGTYSANCTADYTNQERGDVCTRDEDNEIWTCDIVLDGDYDFIDVLAPGNKK
jgi:hypothetical protein